MSDELRKRLQKGVRRLRGLKRTQKKNLILGSIILMLSMGLFFYAFLDQSAYAEKKSAKAKPVASEVLDPLNRIGKGMFNPDKCDKTICYGIKWNVPIETGNIIQTDSLNGDVIFRAVQARNMKDFKCADLYTEVCGDGKDNDYDGQIDEGCVVCGDGKVEGVEQCDDSNINGSDGCSPACVIEAGFNCTGSPSVCVPIVDLCNGIDENGDGQDGENEPWLGQTCDGNDADLCKEGTFICSSGKQLCSDNTNDNLEICDGLDNDCDGLIDEEGVCGICGNGIVEGTEQCDDGNSSNFDFCDRDCQKIPDNDQDNYAGNDCNDGNAAVHPGATEVVGNTLDEDCNGFVACYRDLDNDTFGSFSIDPNSYIATNGIATILCSVNNTDGLDDTSGDCNDTNPAIRPGATEICNGMDDDCDGAIDEMCQP